MFDQEIVKEFFVRLWIAEWPQIKIILIDVYNALLGKF